MKKILFSFTLVSLAALAFCLTPAEVVEKTNANYAGLKSFYTKFTQTMCDEEQGVCRIFDGEIYFLRPNFFRMTIEDPEQVLVGDSSSLWIYLPKEKKAIRQALGQIPFAVNPEIFLKNYDERFNAAMTKEDERSCEITLTPKEESEIFSRIVIAVTIPDYKIAGISIVDQTGAENKFEFEKTQINPKINKQIFQFNPPKGTEIIDQ